jgi:hypothetical protein
VDWASAAAAAEQPPWVALGLAAIAAVGVIATAYGPVLVERARARATARNDPAPPAEKPATPPPPQVTQPPTPPQDSFDLIEDAVKDYRRQRDQAIARADRLQTQLDATRQELHQAQIHIARLEARGRYG